MGVPDKRGDRALAYLSVCIILLAAGLPSVSAKPEGGSAIFTGQNPAREGCTCHSQYPDGSVALSISQIGVDDDTGAPLLMALPEQYEPSTTYTLHIAMDGGPSRDTPAGTGVALGGFALEVTGGSLSKVTTENDTQVFTVPVGNELHMVATHALSGNYDRTWTVNWTSPGPGSASILFYISANSVDDSGNVSGDGYANQIILLKGEGGLGGGADATDVPAVRAYWAGILSFLAIAVIIIFCGALLWSQAQRGDGGNTG